MPGQEHVEVEQEDQADRGVDGVRHAPRQFTRRPPRQRPAAHQPADEAGHGHADGDPGESGRRGTADQQADEAATGSTDGVGDDEKRQRGEAPAPLEDSAHRAGQRERQQRHGQHQRRSGAGQVQQVRDRGRRRQGKQAHRRAERQTEPHAAPERRPGAPEPGHVQRDAGLGGHRRHHADDQQRHQGAQLTEHLGHEQPRRHDGEQVTGRVARHEGGRDQDGLPMQRRTRHAHLRGPPPSDHRHPNRPSVHRAWPGL
jgi:hypothetical protein